jgi:hypothetical protein
MYHSKACTAKNPAKPAGTGLTPMSLTNRLVPGAIAGSKHGKASNRCVSSQLQIDFAMILPGSASSHVSFTFSFYLQYLLYWQFSHCQLPSLVVTKMYFSSMCVIKSTLLEYI